MLQGFDYSASGKRPAIPIFQYVPIGENRDVDVPSEQQISPHWIMSTDKNFMCWSIMISTAFSRTPHRYGAKRYEVKTWLPAPCRSCKADGQQIGTGKGLLEVNISEITVCRDVLLSCSCWIYLRFDFPLPCEHTLIYSLVCLRKFHCKLSLSWWCAPWNWGLFVSEVFTNFRGIHWSRSHTATANGNGGGTIKCID